MSTPLNRFAASPERSEVLGELLHVGGARPGPTLVVALDTDPLDLAGFARVSTPRPPEGENADAILAEVMSPRLSQLAYLFAPQRKELIGRPKRELITIVCREGAPVPTAAEEQFATAWRLARDEAPISRGDVDVVTPQGWACLQGGSGLEPWLEMDRASAMVEEEPLEFPPMVDAEALASDPAVLAAEAVLAEAFAADFDTLAAPNPKECLACYVTRMLAQFGCDGTWSFVDHFRATVAPRATALERRPWCREGVCNCALYELGYDLAEHIDEPVEYTEMGGARVALHHEWPWPPSVAPSCHGVRRGTIKPCSVWQLLPRSGW